MGNARVCALWARPYETWLQFQYEPNVRLFFHLNQIFEKTQIFDQNWPKKKPNIR